MQTLEKMLKSVSLMVTSLIFTLHISRFHQVLFDNIFLYIFPSAHRWIGPENMGCVKISYFDRYLKLRFLNVPDIAYIANLRNFCRFSRFRWRLCAWALRLRRATAWSPSSAAVAIAGSGGGKGHGKKTVEKTVGKKVDNLRTTLENWGNTI